MACKLFPLIAITPRALPCLHHDPESSFLWLQGLLLHILTSKIVFILFEYGATVTKPNFPLGQKSILIDCLIITMPVKAIVVGYDIVVLFPNKPFFILLPSLSGTWLISDLNFWQF